MFKSTNFIFKKNNILFNSKEEIDEKRKQKENNTEK